MKQLIDKSTVVDGIENRIKELQNLYKENKEKLDSIQKTAILLCIDECKGILSFLDSLETKEIDLDYIKDELDRAVKIYKPNGNFGWGTLYNIATHFYELGLKAQKENKKSKT